MAGVLHSIWGRDFYYLWNGIEGDDADMAGGISVFFVGVAERSEIF